MYSYKKFFYFILYKIIRFSIVRQGCLGEQFVKHLKFEFNKFCNTSKILIYTSFIRIIFVVIITDHCPFCRS